eukprot:2001232-Rhodomonas_salina.2
MQLRMARQPRVTDAVVAEVLGGDVAVERGEEVLRGDAVAGLVEVDRDELVRPEEEDRGWMEEGRGMDRWRREEGWMEEGGGRGKGGLREESVALGVLKQHGVGWDGIVVSASIFPIDASRT